VRRRWQQRNWMSRASHQEGLQFKQKSLVGLGSSTLGLLVRSLDVKRGFELGGDPTVFSVWYNVSSSVNGVWEEVTLKAESSQWEDCRNAGFSHLNACRAGGGAPAWHAWGLVPYPAPKHQPKTRHFVFPSKPINLID
jgi:hypothetical protein